MRRWNQDLTAVLSPQVGDLAIHGSGDFIAKKGGVALTNALHTRADAALGDLPKRCQARIFAGKDAGAPSGGAKMPSVKRRTLLALLSGPAHPNSNRA